MINKKLDLNNNVRGTKQKCIHFINTFPHNEDRHVQLRYCLFFMIAIDAEQRYFSEARGFDNSKDIPEADAAWNLFKERVIDNVMTVSEFANLIMQSHEKRIRNPEYWVLLESKLLDQLHKYKEFTFFDEFIELYVICT